MSSGAQTSRYDVVVVGGGSAAFEAAVAAHDAGAERVLVLEKAPLTESGGNAKFSHTGFRFAYSGVDEIRAFLPDLGEEVFRKMHVPAYTAKNFLADLNHVTQNRIDPTLARVLTEDSNAAVHWMRDVGIPWDLAHHIVVDGRLHFEPGIIVHPLGGGIGQLKVWRELAAKRGIEVRYEAPISAILGNLRKVEGVRVAAAEGDVEIEAGALILCAGGFQANREMRARYLSGNSDFMKVRGSRHNTGEVLRMALDLGARSAGHWQGAHATPIDGGSPDYEVPVRSDGMGSWTNRYYYMYGITVNKLGRRFYDEGESQQSYTYAKTGEAVLKQPGGVAYQIFDQKGVRIMKPHAEMHLETKVEAASLAELADKISIDREPFLQTVREYNAATRDDHPFDPTVADGRHTQGIAPAKSNWAIAIDEAPFRAYPITCGITFSFGGLEITPDAQVVGATGKPIENLYAVGDITGLFFHNYPSCTGQTRNVVFARRAACHAVTGNAR